MDPTRRLVMTAGLGAGIASAGASSVLAGRKRQHQNNPLSSPSQFVDLDRDSSADQSHHLQSLIDQHAAARQPLYLPAGRFRVSNIKLRSNSILIGTPGLTEIIHSGGASLVSADDGTNITLDGLLFEGARGSLDAQHTSALVELNRCSDLTIGACTFTNSLLHGLALNQCSGRISACTISNVQRTGLFALDSRGFDISHNDVHDCADNGIQVWRTTAGPDATSITSNRITHIAAQSGGSGQYGNGINVFRAGDVMVSNNHISQCAYSAIRGNAASNIQMLGNACSKIGEVALYAEFEFEGAMISSNLVDTAATGISVTNFQQGGRLATVTNNLVRNLKRREFEQVDKRGIGIAVEADSIVSGNVIENAASCGLALGWGPFRRDIIAAQNIIRNAKIGVLVSGDPNAGPCLISGNLITNTRAGAIRTARYAVPFGPDLAKSSQTLHGITISQNLTT